MYLKYMKPLYSSSPGHTFWWTSQKKEKTSLQRQSCKVMLQCCPLAPHAAKPTYWVRCTGFCLFSFFLITGSFHLQTFLVHFLLSNAIVFDYAGHSIMQNLPTAVQTVCDTWNSIHTNEFPNIGSWVCTSVGYVQFQFGQLHCMMLKWFFFLNVCVTKNSWTVKF